MGLANRVWIVAVVVLAGVASANGQVVPAPSWPSPAASPRAWSANVIVPQSGSRSVSLSAHGAGLRAGVELTGVKVEAVIQEQTSTTTLDLSLRNLTGSRQEAELLVPVPDGAVVRGFSYQGAAKEPTAELLPREQADATYKSIVSSMRDPALLEFAGYNVIRSSVFPVEANGVQKVRLVYEQILPADGGRVDYMLPRTESLDYKVPWEVSVRIQSRSPISTVYSSSHALTVTRSGDGVVTATIPAAAMAEPGPVLVSYLKQVGDGVTMSMYSYPDPKIGGGYFLLLAGLPARKSAGPAVKREGRW